MNALIGKVLLLLLFADFVIDITSEFYYLFNRESGIRSLTKISSVLFFFYALIYIIKTDKLVMLKESYLFVVCSMVPVAIGLMEYNFNSDFISHLFTFIMPIFTMSLGYSMAKLFSYEKLKKYIKKGMGFIYYYSISIIMLFQLAVNAGYIKYSAINPIGLYTATIYFLVNKNYLRAIVGFLFIAISGKRATLVIAVFVLFYYLYLLLKTNKKYLPGIIGFFIIMTGSLFYLFNSTRYLDRFKLVFMFDFTDYHSMYIATGGRSVEILEIINQLNQNIFYWFFGIGFGSGVQIHEELYRHFSHFSPLAYTLVYGIFFTIFLYFFFFKEALIKKSETINTVRWYKLVYVGLFISTFFNAASFFDPKYWLFYGLTKHFNLHTKNDENFSLNKDKN